MNTKETLLEILQEIEKEKDFALLDVNMNRYNGLDIAKRIIESKLLLLKE